MCVRVLITGGQSGVIDDGQNDGQWWQSTMMTDGGQSGGKGGRQYQ